MPSAGSSLTSLEILLSTKPQSSEDTAALLRVGSLVNSTLELKEVLRLTMEEASKLTRAEASAVLLIEKGTGDLVFEVATGSKGEGTKEIRLKKGEGVAGWVATHDRPVRVDDAQDDPRFTTRVDEKTEFVTRSILCVPLKVKGRMIGVLEVINKRDARGFTDHDEEFLVILSHQIATAIDNAQLYRRVFEEKETLSAILESMADGVLVVDRNDKILLSNQSLLDLLNVDAEDLSLSQFGEGGIRGPADQRTCGADHSVSYDLKVRNADGVITLANTATVLKDPAGQVTGSVMVMRDVTEAARVERMKNDFIATTSHKLRTPLTAILSYASLLKSKDVREAASEDSEDIVGEGAAVIEEQSRYLRDLIEKLLAFSGMETESIRLERESCDVARFLKNAVDAMDGCSCTNAKDARFVLGNVPDRLAIPMDTDKMHQVLKNLLENAVKFGPPESPVSVGVEIAGEEIRIWVSDQGPGIPDGEQDRIFEKFYQIDRDLTGQVEGAGLGLALCRNIVLAHGGRIHLDSEPGRGSTFSVHLPSR